MRADSKTTDKISTQIWWKLQLTYQTKSSLYFSLFYYFFCSCLGARKPLPNPRAAGRLDLLSQEGTCSSAQFPDLIPSPFTPNPSPQLPVRLTAAIQCFWPFLNLTKGAYFKTLYQITFSYCPKSSSQPTAAALGGNCPVHWYKKLIWIISLPEKLEKTPGCVKVE